MSGEVKRLQRCLNDLVSVLALPAMWSGGPPSQIVHTLVDALLSMLSLDLVYARLQDPAGDAPIRGIEDLSFSMNRVSPDEIHKTITQLFGRRSAEVAVAITRSMADEMFSVVSQRCGLHGEIGVIVAGAQRTDFPEQAETLLLSVAAG